jgi:hypothetical protein
MQMLMLGMAALTSVTGTIGADSRPLDGVLDGDHLVLTTEAGVRCEGELLRMTRDGGLGSFVCEDGRKGSFEWTITPLGAVADGTFGGESLELSFIRAETPTQF